MAKPLTIDEVTIYDIYCLIDPETKRPRYIGKANDYKKRLQTHLQDSKRRKTPVYCWIRKLKKKGLIPEIILIEQTTDWVEAEVRIIKEYREKYPDLLNLADGGNQPYCDKRTRANNGRNNAKKIHSDPVRKKIWALKRELCSMLKRGVLREDQKERLRKIALRNPSEFGVFLKYV